MSASNYYGVYVVKNMYSAVLNDYIKIKYSLDESHVVKALKKHGHTMCIRSV